MIKLNKTNEETYDRSALTRINYPPQFWFNQSCFSWKIQT